MPKTVDLNSFAHPEITTGEILHSIDGAQPEMAFYSSIQGLDMCMYRPQYQTFQWQETTSCAHGEASGSTEPAARRSRALARLRRCRCSEQDTAP